MLNSRPCIVCRRPEDDPLHGPQGGQARNTLRVRIELHDYDPGERRRMIRRDVDRVAAIEKAMHG